MSWLFNLGEIMTLTVTLELSPAEEQQLRKSIAGHNAEIVRQLLLNALEPTVTDLLSHPVDNINVQQRRHELTERLHNIVAESLPHDFQGLSDYAVSREGIYADHR